MNKKLIKQSLLGLVIGAGITYTGYLLVSKETLLKVYAYDSAFIMIPSLVLAIFTAIALHELGHLFMGIVQGFRVELFVVAFLGIERKEGKLKLFFNTDIQYFGGIAATSPTKKYPNIREKFAWVVAGGPLFSILFGVLFFLIFSWQYSPFNSYLAFTGFMNLLLVVATTLPEKSGSFFTDRKRLQRLLDKGQDGRVELALLESINQNLIDGHCKNISSENIAVIKSAEEPFIQFWGYYFEIQMLKDTGIEDLDTTLTNQLKTYEPHFPKATWKAFGIE